MRSMSFLFLRQGNKYACTAGAGTYLKCAIKLPHPLSHPGNSDSQRCRAFDLSKLFHAHSMTIVFYFEGYFLLAERQDHSNRSPTGVPQYVVHALLHDTK